MDLFNGFSFNELEEKAVNPAVKRYPSRRIILEQTIVLSLSGFDLERSNNEMFRSNSWRKNMAELSHDIDSIDKSLEANRNRNTLI